MNIPVSKHLQLLTFLLLLNISAAFAQAKDSTCRVLLNEISGSYKGGCKNGLANGRGTASGEDTYTGAFLNGLPEGKGTYQYRNGNEFVGNWKNGLKNGKGEFRYIVNGKATVVKGYWKDGDYAGTQKPADDFRITNKSGIDNYTIRKTSETENLIEISFEKVMRKYIPGDLTVNITSGYTTEQNLKILVQDCTYPAECTLHYTIPRSGGLWQCNFTFIILKPGKYEVFLSNN